MTCTRENCPFQFNVEGFVCSVEDCKYRTLPRTKFELYRQDKYSLAVLMSTISNCDKCFLSQKCTPWMGSKKNNCAVTWARYLDEEIPFEVIAETDNEDKMMEGCTCGWW